MDVLGDFLAECCLVHPDAKAASQHMYAEYRRWATDAGERVLPQKRFSQWMEHRGSQAGFRKQHTNQGKTWVGLGLALAPALADGGAESQ